MILDVVVVDLIPPTLVLSYQEVMLDIYNYNEYNVDFFNNYIFSLTDNYSKPVNIILTIDCSLLQEEVADYNVYYTATDENDNKIKHQLVVKLREFIGPEIICEDVVKVKLGSNVDLLSLVEVFDKYDSNAISRLSVISDGFDISILGSYEVKYTCFNTSGIFTEKTVTIIVEEDIENVDEIEVKEPVLDVNLLIIIGACLLGVGCIVVVIVYKKRKNK